jgi:aryl-alcohol dehydrogenase-like predicted oxidoreductase
MDWKPLGRSGLKVPPLCLGTMALGEPDDKSFMHGLGADEKTSFEIMNRAVDAGVGFFDTADVYGNDGLTEKLIGRWFERDKRREQVVLATKCRFRMAPGPNGTGASRLRITRACEESLRRLRTDRIDLYQIHMQDLDTPEEETLRALDDLVRQGKVLYIGASNYAAYRLVDSLWTSRTLGLARFVSAQMQYSLIERSVEREHVPACLLHGVGLLPWSPLAAGFLTGKQPRGGAGPAGSRVGSGRTGSVRIEPERGFAVLDALADVSRQVGSTSAAVALAWLMHKPVVSSVIFGARTLEQLAANLSALEVRLAPEQLALLDAAGKPAYGYPYEFIANVQGRW